MGATTTATRERWVVCDDYADGPHTADEAVAAKSRIGRGIHCSLAHRIITSATKPVTVAELQTLRAEWDEPWLGDSTDEHDNAERTAQTGELAATILAASIGTRVGGFKAARAGWSAQTAARANALADPGSGTWFAALGQHEDALLTSDGCPVLRDSWCRCEDTAAESWTAYEAWTAERRVAHGFACSTCRMITQTG